MKLEKPTNRSKRGRPTEMLLTEQPVKSEIFDPRLDVPAGDLDRIKHWANKHPGTAEQTHLLVQTAWIGWVDPEHRRAVQDTPGVRESELAQCIGRRNGGRLRLAQMPDDPSKAALWKLTEKAAAYIDFSDLVEVFPEVRQELRAPEFVDDFQQVLDQAVSQNVDGFSISVVNRIQDLRTMIQAWPERRAEVIQTLAEGGQDRQEWFVERIEAEDLIVHAMAAAASLMVVFPELRPLVEGVVKKRMKEIHTKLRQMHAQLDEEGESFYYYARFIKHLTILGAESARLDVHGDLQVKLRPLALGGMTQPLPDRPQV